MQQRSGESDKHIVYNKSVHEWSIRATVVGEEYRDDVLGSFDSLADDTCEISEVYLSEDSLHLEITIGVLRKKTTAYHYAMLVSRWAAIYSEALEDVQIIGLVDEPVSVPRNRRASKQLKTPAGYAANPTTNPETVTERDVNRAAEAAISALAGGPEQHPRPREFHQKKLPTHRHIAQRDGRCFHCDGPLDAHSLKVASPLLQMNIENNDYARFSGIGSFAYIGICYFCQRRNIKHFDTAFAERHTDPQWRARVEGHLQRISDRINEYPRGHERVARLVATTQQVLRDAADADESTRGEIVAQAAAEFKAADAPARVAHYTKKVQKLLDRDGVTTCAWCDGAFQADNIPTVDHVVPKSYGGTKDPRNLITVCSSCNHTRGNKTITEWLNYCHRQQWNPHFENLSLRLNDMADEDGPVGEFAKNDLMALIADRLNSAAVSSGSRTSS